MKNEVVFGTVHRTNPWPRGVGFTPYPAEDLWFRVNNLQKRYMAKPWTTKKEFFAESEAEQEKYYRFLYKQAGYHADILELTPPKRTRKRNPCTTRKRNPCTPEARARATMAKMAPALNALNHRRRNPAGLSHEAWELILWVENSQALQNQRESIIKNVIRRINNGTYDPAKAPRLWQYLMESAAKDYTKEFGTGTGYGIFTPTIRREAATWYAPSEYASIANGEYSHLLALGKKKKPRKKPRLRLVPKKKNPRRRKKTLHVIAFNTRTHKIFWYTVGDRFSPYDVLAAPFGTMKDALTTANKHTAGANEIILVAPSTWSKAKLLTKLKFSFGK